jgi:hypothetical protein
MMSPAKLRAIATALMVLRTRTCLTETRLRQLRDASSGLDSNLLRRRPAGFTVVHRTAHAVRHSCVARPGSSDARPAPNRAHSIPTVRLPTDRTVVRNRSGNLLPITWDDADGPGELSIV